MRTEHTGRMTEDLAKPEKMKDGFSCFRPPSSAVLLYLRPCQAGKGQTNSLLAASQGQTV